jgi:hypothetical protein
MNAFGFWRAQGAGFPTDRAAIGEASPVRRSLRACHRGGAIVAFGLVVLMGHIVDRSTGQPLVGVDVSASGAAKISPGKTNDAGQYTLRGMSPGHYTLTVSSDDVPPQTFELDVHGAKVQHFNITACSTTLDYSCAAPQP